VAGCCACSVTTLAELTINSARTNFLAIAMMGVGVTDLIVVPDIVPDIVVPAFIAPLLPAAARAA
jgi:hypothetical protein